MGSKGSTLVWSENWTDRIDCPYGPELHLLQFARLSDSPQRIEQVPHAGSYVQSSDLQLVIFNGGISKPPVLIAGALFNNVIEKIFWYQYKR